MDIVRVLATSVVVIPLGLSLFLGWAMQECKDFSIPSQEGKVFLVTGSNAGLGFHTSLDLAKAGGEVVMGVRSLERGQEAKKAILDAVPGAKVEVMQVDLGSLKSVRSFAERFTTKYPSFDVLVNNAGVAGSEERKVTEDGLESTIAVNHLGPFLLTSLLLPHLKTNGRVVNHSSGMHRLASSSFLDDLQSKSCYKSSIAYANSKAANLLFTYGLQKHLKTTGNPRNITVVAAHPGMTSTSINDKTGMVMENLLNTYFGMDIAHGSQSQTLAATSPHIGDSVGTYLGPRFVAFGAPRVVTTSSFANSEENQLKLWKESMKLTGAKY